MKSTSPITLAASALAPALAPWMILAQFFGALGPRSWWNFGFPWLFIAVCVAAAWWIKSVLEEGEVGQDRSQVQPLTLPRQLVIGAASAWLGVILGGLYAGGVLWALSKWTELATAQADGPAMIADTVSGILLATAGLWLEKVCQLPTDSENSSPPDGEMGINSIGQGL